MTVWLSERLVLAMHDEQLRNHGGASGLRDSGLLESAVARPLNRARYAEPATVELGALYAIGIARNHPFVDGNKRTAYMALVTFLELNGVGFEPPDADALLAMLSLADGRMTDEEFTQWVRQHCGGVSGTPSGT